MSDCLCNYLIFHMSTRYQTPKCSKNILRSVLLFQKKPSQDMWQADTPALYTDISQCLCPAGITKTMWKVSSLIQSLHQSMTGNTPPPHWLRQFACRSCWLSLTAYVQSSPVMLEREKLLKWHCKIFMEVFLLSVSHVWFL